MYVWTVLRCVDEVRGTRRLCVSVSWNDRLHIRVSYCMHARAVFVVALNGVGVHVRSTATSVHLAYTWYADSLLQSPFSNAAQCGHDVHCIAIAGASCVEVV